MPYRPSYWRILRTNHLLVRTLALILAVVAMTVGVFILVNQVSKNTDDLNQNTQSIEKGCILLQNAIVKATAPPPAGSPPDATQVLVGSILKRMTPAERKRYKDAASQPPRLLDVLVDCKKVAQNPDSIRAVPVPKPK
jgi:hypothetical protein